MNVAREVRALDESIRQAGRPERAEGERRYLKSELVHYGSAVPVLRTAVRGFLRSRPDLEHDQLISLATELWCRPETAPVHERRLAAVLLLAQRVRLLGPDDVPLLEQLIRQGRTWALVDPLATDVAGPLLDQQDWADPVLERWAGDADFWIRRAALLAHLRPLRAGEGDLDRFLRLADGMLEEREFFIRKAIGWVLRETGRRRPDEVLAWLLPRARRASGLTLREATRHLPDAARTNLLMLRG